MSHVLIIDNLNQEFVEAVHIKNCLIELNKHYPGWMWGVQVSETGSMTYIRNGNISASKGFALYTRGLTGDALKQKVVKAGGEILERANIERRRFNAEKHTELKMNHAGEVIHETG